MTPLDLTAFAETLILVWLFFLIVPLGEVLIAKYRGRLSARLLLLSACRYVSYTCMYTICSIGLRANSLGLISHRLYAFTCLMAALAVAGGMAAGHLAPPSKARSEG